VVLKQLTVHCSPFPSSNTQRLEMGNYRKKYFFDTKSFWAVVGDSIVSIVSIVSGKLRKQNREEIFVHLTTLLISNTQRFMLKKSGNSSFFGLQTFRAVPESSLFKEGCPFVWIGAVRIRNRC
jgi:hypothetical protein